MSQRNVERVIGKLVTDEAFRRAFATDAQGALRETLEHGLELTACERHALAALDIQVLEGLARAIDPRLQKAAIDTKTDNEGGGIH